MRIVSLLPSATEILFAIGAGDDLVGVTHECDYPPEARDLPTLTSSTLPDAAGSAQINCHMRTELHEGSSLYALDHDLLEQLEPDLIITQELCSVCALSYDIVATAAKRLRSDPRVLSLEPSSLAEVLQTIAFLGELTEHTEQAQQLLRALDGRLMRLRSETTRVTQETGEDRPRTLLLEWTDPPMSAGRWASSLLEYAGGVPVLSNPGGNSQRITWENLHAQDPEVIIIAPCGFDLAKTRSAAEALHAQEGWRTLRAVREQEVFLLDGNAYLNRPSPRLVDTAEMFATMLWGDEIDLPILDPQAWEPLHS